MTMTAKKHDFLEDRDGVLQCKDCLLGIVPLPWVSLGDLSYPIEDGLPAENIECPGPETKMLEMIPMSMLKQAISDAGHSTEEKDTMRTTEQTLRRLAEVLSAPPSDHNSDELIEVFGDIEANRQSAADLLAQLLPDNAAH